MTKIILRVALLAVVGFILLLFLWPDLRSSASQTITRLTVSAEPVSVPTTPGGAKRVFLKHVILSRSGAQAKNLVTLTVGWSGDASGFALSMTGCLRSGNTFENTL